MISINKEQLPEVKTMVQSEWVKIFSTNSQSTSDLNNEYFNHNEGQFKQLICDIEHQEKLMFLVKTDKKG